MTYICYRGIEVSARIQYGLLGVEVRHARRLRDCSRLVKVYSGGAPTGRCSRAGRGCRHPGSPAPSIVTATLIAVFIYWGWDTAVATNEEADDPASTPGRAAIMSTVLLLLTYALVSVATIAFAGVGSKGIGLGNADNADDVFARDGQRGLRRRRRRAHHGGPADDLRAHIGLGVHPDDDPADRPHVAVDGGRSRRSRTASPGSTRRYLTPTDSTIWMGGVSIVFYVGLTLVSQNILADTIAAVGLMIAFYYGLTGFACAWFYRKTMWAGPRDTHHAGRAAEPRSARMLLLARSSGPARPTRTPTTATRACAASAASSCSASARWSLGVVLMFVYQAVRPGVLPRRDAAQA